MGEQSKIQWCDSTFNPWSGCTKISEGCANCYAARDAARMPNVHGTWGPQGTRVARVESYWHMPIAWDKDAAKTGRRHLVFCASMADVFEEWGGGIVRAASSANKGRLLDPAEWYASDASGRLLTMDDLRLRLYDTIRRTPHLTWLLLTKRPENVLPMIRRCMDLLRGRKASEVWNVLGWMADWLNGKPPANVWMGVTAENQERADERIPVLLKIPAAVRWVSYEPALGPVDWRRWLDPEFFLPPGVAAECYYDPEVMANEASARGLGIDWIICGGESGPQARPFDLAWARSARDQCKAAGVPFFMKQVGARPCDWHHIGYGQFKGIKHRAGADPDEWPEDIRIREFPR